MIDIVTAKTKTVIAEVSSQLPKDFPKDVSNAIFAGMVRLSNKLASQ